MAQRAAAGKGCCRACLVFAGAAALLEQKAEVEAARGIARIAGPAKAAGKEAPKKEDAAGAMIQINK